MTPQMGYSESLRKLIQRNWRATAALGGILLDVAVCAAAFVLSEFILSSTGRGLPTSTLFYFLFPVSILVYVCAFTMSGNYRTLTYSSFRAQVRRAFTGYLYGSATLLSLVFLVGNNSTGEAAFFELFLVVLPPVYIAAWYEARTLGRTMRQRGFGRSNTIAVGSDPDFHRLLQRVERHPELGYTIVSVLRPQGQGAHGDVVGDAEIDKIKELTQQHAIDQIVFSSSYQLNGSFQHLYQYCRDRRIAMRIVSPESDMLFSHAGLRDIAGIPVFVPQRFHIGRLKEVTKRVFDIIGSLSALIVLSPVFVVVAAAIKIESHGPVFFRQRRSLGADHPPFLFFKFRSMYFGADKQKEGLRDQNESDGALFKMKDDPRLTRVGRLIRKYSIDELPQLFNVLRGEMTLVGPRPLPISDYTHMDFDDHLNGYLSRRAQVKPGMTGLWQVSGRSDLGFREMVLLDLYYIEHQTLMFDIEILAQTVPVVLFGRGAY